MMHGRFISHTSNLNQLTLNYDWIKTTFNYSVMIATTHTTSEEPKHSKNEKNNFDYSKFAKELKMFKFVQCFTYSEISEATGISPSILIRVMNNRYASDLSLNYAIQLCKFMNKNFCSYIK